MLGISYKSGYDVFVTRKEQNDVIDNVEAVDAIDAGYADSDYVLSEIEKNSVTNQDIVQVIEETLQIQDMEIQGEFTFKNTGALKVIDTDDNNYMLLSPTGLLAKDAGTTIFALSDTGLTMRNGNILAGTITGATVQTGTTGRRIRMASDQYIRWYNNDNTEAYIFTDTGGNLFIDADNLIYIQADGTGDDIFVTAGDNLALTGNTLFCDFTGDIMQLCDTHAVFYDEDDDGDECYWYSDGDRKMRLDTGGELFVEDGVSTGGEDFAEFFENANDEIIPVGTSVFIDNGKIRKAMSGEVPFGVVSNTASYVGNNGANNAGTEWGEKYKRDEDGEFITEEVQMWKGVLPLNYKKETGQTVVKKEKVKGFVEKEQMPGNIKNVEYYRKTVRVLNEEYDPTQKYIPRSERKNEWSVVGLFGQVKILKNQEINPNWVFMGEYNDKYNKYLIK